MCGVCGGSHRGRCGGASVKDLIAKINDKTATQEKWFYIIDMQNDFINAQKWFFKRDEKTNNAAVTSLSGNNSRGTFAVAGSGDGTFLTDMADFIKKQAKQPNTHFVVSRDYHPVDHCSFNGKILWNDENIGYSYNKDVINAIQKCTGQYPPHCIQGTLGAQMNPIIQKALENAVASMTEQDIKKRFHVAFKGWHPEADSYGCHPYAKKYAEIRLPNNTTTDFTGGFTLNDKSFKEALRFGENEHELIPPTAMKDMKITNFSGPPKNAIIYVFGLAGNFCVQDTAINLKDDQFTDVTVLNKYTMYADYSNPDNSSLLTPHQNPLQFTNSNNTDKDTKSYLKSNGVHLIHDIGDNLYIHTTRSDTSLDDHDHTGSDVARPEYVKYRGGKRSRRKNTPKSRQRRR